MRSATGVADGPGMLLVVVVTVTFGMMVVAEDLAVIVGVVTDGFGVVININLVVGEEVEDDLTVDEDIARDV
jgi:hypothetical protein